MLMFVAFTTSVSASLLPDQNVQSLTDDKTPPKDLALAKSPFDPSKIRNLDTDSNEFAAKYKQGQHQNLTKELPFLQSNDISIQNNQITADYEHHTYWGSNIPDWFESTQGVYARHSISPTIYFGDDTILYAPTLKSPQPCPLEVGVKYTSSTPFLFVYDHYIGSFTDIEMTFNDLSSDGYLSNNYYDITIVLQDGTWGAYLYNYAGNTWDRIYNQPNNAYIGIPNGWDMYEAYYNGDWQGTNYLRASEIMAYLWDLEFGYQWYYNYWYVGGSESNNWPGGLNIPHSMVSAYDSWWVGTTSFYPSSIDWTYTSTYGGGELYDAGNILSQNPDTNYATLIDMYSSSSSRIVAQMNDDATGTIYVNSYSESGYHGYLYIYVSMSPSGGWTQVGSPLGIGHTSASWDNIGYYAGQFRYIAVCGYNPGGNPVRLHIDAVNVNPG
jgi:hypothetical protein